VCTRTAKPALLFLAMQGHAAADLFSQHFGTSRHQSIFIPFRHHGIRVAYRGDFWPLDFAMDLYSLKMWLLFMEPGAFFCNKKY
jgi:hypothetical protein